MAQRESKMKELPGGKAGSVPSLADLKALRLAQRETNQRVEELKLKLFHATEQHMDQAVRLIRRMMKNKGL
ncbi:MAG: flagellar M-ring protein FliF [Desulfovibrio sp.]|nr:flagellar M-ring protein FliF [Desulfovibrio sp.]